MPISIECPECGSKNRFPDHLEGKSGRCKNCGERVAIRGSRRKSGKKRNQQSSSTGLIIGGIAGGLILVVAVGLFFILNSGGEGDQPLLTQENSLPNTTSNSGTAPADQSETDSSGENSPSLMLATTSPSPTTSTPTNATPMSSTPSTGTNTTTPATNPSASASGFSKPNAATVPDQLTFNRSSTWTAEPDPATGPIDFTQGKPLRVKLLTDGVRGAGVLFPVSPSSIFAVRAGTSSKSKYVIQDASTGRQLGETPAGNASSLAALADDGSYLALLTAGSKHIEVFDIAGKKSLGTLSYDADAPFQVTTLAIWKHKLVALSNIHKGIKVWELPSGNLVQNIKGGDKFNPDYGHCFSPGGRYLAVDGEFLEKRIDLYDLTTGQIVGVITPAGKVRVNELEALGFSSDGTQLAIIYGVDIFSAPARKYSRMVVWNLAEGKITSDFELEPRLKEQLDPVYKSRTLESFPGGNRWLVHSLGVIDAGIEQLVYSFPKQPNVDLVPSRKVMGSNWVTAAISEGGDPRLELNTISEEVLLAGAASASAGGFASDAKLPPLTPSNFEQSPDAIASNEWRADADPLILGQIKDSIAVSTTGTVRDVAVARGTNPVIAVRAGIDEDLNDPAIKNYEQSKAIFASRGLDLEQPQPIAKESEIVAFDATGMQISKFRIPFSTKLQGISPDGALAVLEEHRTNGRLDIYALQEEGQHLVGWRPFRSESDKNHRDIKHVEFVTANLIATLNKNYKLVVWKLPSLEPVWKLDEVLDFTVSPGGKQVAVIRGNILGAKGLAMFESQSGQGLGVAELEGQAKSLAIHPDGELLAISFDSEANKTLRIIDLRNGLTVEEIPIPVVAKSIFWGDQDNLLLNGGQLLNRSLQSIVWSYTTDGVVVPENQLGGKLSFTQKTGARSVLRSVAVPSESVTSKLNPSRLLDLALLKPGDAVGLSVQIGSEPEVLLLKDAAHSTLSGRLEAAKSKVSEGAHLTLSVTISLKGEGTASISKIGDRSVAETVNRKAILIDLTYRAQGKQIWKSTRRVGNLDRILVRLKQGQSAQAGIDEQMTENAESLLKGIKLPSYIFGENASKGLGTSPLTQ